MVFSDKILLSTGGFCDVIDVTDGVADVLNRSGIRDGLLTVFCPGSTGAVTTIEYEAGVIEDLRKALEMIVPSDMSYEHNKRWGDGNGFSHVRAALMKPSLTVPVHKGRPVLGTWQQIVFLDFDNRGRRREVFVQAIGE